MRTGTAESGARIYSAHRSQCRGRSFTPLTVETPFNRPYGKDEWKYKPMQTIPFRRSYR